MFGIYSLFEKKMQQIFEKKIENRKHEGKNQL